MKAIKIQPLNKVGTNERGVTYDFSSPLRGDFILITRKSGSESGNTYHKGVSEKVNPKYFVLVSGSVEFLYRHIDVVSAEKVTINEPSLIEIPVMITHSMKALTDIVVLECNAIKDIQNDRHHLNVILE